MSMLGLLENETLKVLRRKRFRLILCVLAALLTLVVFAQNRARRADRKESAAATAEPAASPGGAGGGAPLPAKVAGDWRPSVEKRIAEMERRLRSPRTPEGFARYMKYESGRLRYHLEKGINPDQLTAPVFTRGFAGVGSVLLIPLLVAVFAADLVSSEFAEGTVTLLLTRPVARWKVLLSKYAAMLLFTTLTLLASAALAWAIAGVAFGWSGWGAPILTGFRLGSGGFDAAGVRMVPLWQDTIAAYGLAWISAVSVGSITLLLSVVFRSAAAAMGTMMATLIGGTILSRVASDWDGAKWFFVTNLPLPDYYAGMPTPFAGMSLAFCVTVLLGWALAATATAFVLFVRRDVVSGS